MSVGTSAAIAIAAGIGAAGSIGSAVIGSHAAGKAANQQQVSLQQAIDQWMKIQEANNGLLSPYETAGSTALPQLQALLAKGAPSFTAPTGVNMQNDPGYQFRMQQGQKALEQSAAARGGALGGGALKDLTQFGQNFGSNEYQNVYNRALSGFGANLAGYQTNLGGLENLAGLGLSAAGTNVGANLGVGQGITGATTGIGNAQAAGTIGSANAWAGGLGGLGNSISQFSLLNSILNPPTAPAPAPWAGGTSDPTSGYTNWGG